MRGTSVYRKKEEAEKPRPRTVLLNTVILIVIAVIAYFLAGFLIDQLDLYSLLGLSSVEIRGTDVAIPNWALQLALGVIIFFVLQPIVVILLDLLGIGKQEEEIDTSPTGHWKR